MARRLYDEHVHNSMTFIKNTSVPQATHEFHWLYEPQMCVYYLEQCAHNNERQKKKTEERRKLKKHKQQTADWCHRAQIMNNLTNKSRTAATEY